VLEEDDIEMTKGLREILYRRFVTRPDGNEYVFPGPSGGKLSKNTMDKILPRLFKKLNTDEDGDPKREEDQIQYIVHSFPLPAHAFANKVDKLLISIVYLKLKFKYTMLSDKHNHLVKKDIHLAYPCKSTLDRKHFIYRFKQPLQLFYNLFTNRPKGKVSALG